MNRATLRLAVTRTLKVYSGEGGRIIAFSVLHILISLVIGMVSTVVDALTVGSAEAGGSYLLYGISAVVLAVIGYIYAGVTDRTDKRRVLTRVLLLSAAVCLLAAGLLVVSGQGGPPESLLAGLFVWRFLIGIVLLMVFWDMTPFYFNARQGKRLFPILAIGGAIGYSVGSLIAGLLTGVFPAWVMLVIIGTVTLAAMAWFQTVRRDYSILDSPRYRDRSIVAEVRDGFAVFWGNPFLRAVGWNTVLFGILSGLIVFTYNALVTARTTGAAGAAEVLGLQRAAVTILQATVLTKVLSQSAVGGRGKSSLIQQTFFLVLGTAAFIVSMVGVADFTRQIEVALMSPAAIAAFAFLPARYRGRVMVLNNMVAAAAGILIATFFVALVAPLVEPLWFAYPIVALMIARIAFGALLNRRYTALLSQSIVSDRKLNLSRIEENTVSILQDESLISRLREELSAQSASVRVFVLGRLARAVQSTEDIERIAPFFEHVSRELNALWIETLARIDYSVYQEEIEAGIVSPVPEVRIASRLATLCAMQRRGDTEHFQEEITRLTGELAMEIDGGGDTAENEEEDRFRELVDLFLRIENATGSVPTEIEWTRLSDAQRAVLLELLATRPSVHHFAMLLSLLSDATWASPAVAAIAALPAEFLIQHREEWREAPTPTRLELLRMLHDPVLRREESVDLLSGFLAPVDAAVGEERDIAFTALIRHGEEIITTALIVLSDSDQIPPPLVKMARRSADGYTGLLPELFQLRFAAEDSDATVRPLSTKVAREYLHRAAATVLLLKSMTIPKEEDRILAYSVCRELTERAAVIHHNAMEFIETRIEGDAKTYLLTYFEAMTIAEKRGRLRTLLKGTTDTVAAIATRREVILRAEGDTIGSELVGLLATGTR